MNIKSNIVINCGNPTSNLSEYQLYLSGSPPSSFNYAANSQLKCETGYEFSDGTAIKQIQCTSAGIWSPPGADCNCLSKSKLYFSILRKLI